MSPSLSLAVITFAAPVIDLPAKLWQVAPDNPAPPWLVTRKERAVVLVHGLRFHPLRPTLATRPARHEWQEPRSELVKALAADADIYAFSYAQTVPLDAVAHSAGLREAVGQLRAAGYREIVLIGHSAGGVISRLFVENYPDAGVTKVIQAAAPNTGSEVAAVLKNGAPKFQAPFVQSLTPSARFEAFRMSKNLLSPKLEIACIVCKVKRIEGDGLVPLASQWPDELQQQGVPAVLVPVSHWEVMNTAAGVKAIAALAREKLTRWSPEQADRARKVLFRDEPN
ncbi:MAG TPA: alpha/beta fold hydrolase [Gemmataceae bacterium]|nr:alpha/beta fold hydrolase [Gemmataceae bacterium]